MKTYDVDYTLDGRTYGVRLLAENEADAHRRLYAIAANGRIGGEIVGEIKGNSLTLPFDWLATRLALLVKRH